MHVQSEDFKPLRELVHQTCIHMYFQKCKSSGEVPIEHAYYLGHECLSDFVLQHFFCWSGRILLRML